MKYIAFPLLLASGMALASLPAPSPLKPQDCALPGPDPQVLLKQVDELNAVAGSYPPRLKNAAERQQVLQYWNQILIQAKTLRQQEGDSERALDLLAELYRQGHNLDVPGAAAETKGLLDLCLGKYPASTACNFSALYFYLSATPMMLDRVEASLKTLREEFGSKANPEVERAYVFFYIYGKRKDEAIAQIDHFLALFPENSQGDALRKVREALLQDRLTIRQH